MLKLCICLIIPSFLFGFNAYEDRNFSSLCNLYRQKERAMYYGDYGGARSIQKRIESYKMRFGIEKFDAIFQNGMTGFLTIITATIITIITAICRASKHFKNNLDCLGFFVVLTRFYISGILAFVV